MSDCRPCARHAPAISGDCRRAADAVEGARPRRTNWTAATMAATIAGSVLESAGALAASASAAAAVGAGVAVSDFGLRFASHERLAEERRHDGERHQRGKHHADARTCDLEALLQLVQQTPFRLAAMTL